MDSKASFVDYYSILLCDRNASTEELKKSYHRLALTSHPDKKGNGMQPTDFSLVQKAWMVLRNPESRKQYDAELSCQEHSDFLLFDTICLKDMEYNSSDGVYMYSCRCGGTYLLEESDSMPSKAIIGCDECSFSIQVNL